MKGKVKKLLYVVIIIALVMAYLSPLFNTVVNAETSTASSGARANSATQTGEMMYIGCYQNLGYGGFWTYWGNGDSSRVNYNFYCANKGGSQGTSGREYSNPSWSDSDAIWKNPEAFKKMNWIKDNFVQKFGKTGYTAEEKCKILEKADKSITTNDINTVFDNGLQQFLLYQQLIWTYTNGNAIQESALNGATKKVYDAITKLANEKYENEAKITVEEKSSINIANGEATWGVKVTNNCLLDYEVQLIKDGETLTRGTDYEYNNDVVTIKNLGANFSLNEHIFEFVAKSKKTIAEMRIWHNSYNQDFIEITDSEVIEVKDSISATTEPNKGYYRLELNKVNMDNVSKKPNATFIVNDTTYDTINGVAKIPTEGELDVPDDKKIIEYTISEANVEGNYVKLKDPVRIMLRTGFRREDGQIYYYISEAFFAENSKTEINKNLDNGKSVTLRLFTEQVKDNNHNITIIKLSIPNAEKQYDLALTKSIILPELSLKYDYNNDGKVKASDATFLTSVASELNSVDVATVESIAEKVKEVLSAKSDYYKICSEEEIAARFDIAYDKITKGDLKNIANVISESVADQTEGHNGKIDNMGDNTNPGYLNFDFNLDGTMELVVGGTTDYSTVNKIYNNIEGEDETEISKDSLKTAMERVLPDKEIDIDSMYKKFCYAAIMSKMAIKAHDIAGEIANGNLGGIDRINRVDTSKLNRKDSDNNLITTANYNMNKTTYGVKKDDIITYKITVYNEGDYNAKNIKIVDYLPDELVICDSSGNEVTSGEVTCKAGSNTYTWSVENNKATITIQNVIDAYTMSSGLDKEDVYINCKIKDEYKNNSNEIYNVAEIVESTPCDENGNNVTGLSDRDSTSDNVTNLQGASSTDIVEKYRDEKVKSNETIINKPDDVDKSAYNYEDDDDFERIIIVPDRSLDLALRKSITKIGTNEQNMQEVSNRLPKITENTISNCQLTGTGAYEHGKEAVEVEVGDFVEYTIRVYNEGGTDDYSGYATTIKDYLPEGLEFYAVVNNNGKWVTKDNGGNAQTDENKFGGWNVSYQNKEVNIQNTGNISLYPTNYLKRLSQIDEEYVDGYYNCKDGEINPYAYIYQEIKIICQVSENAKANVNLTNIAEITGMSYINDDKINSVIESDRDSTVRTINITTSNTDKQNQQVNLSTYYNDREVDDTYNIYYPGLQDDDDFETVKVNKVESHSYEFVLNKVGEDNQPIDGAMFTITKDGETIVPSEVINGSKSIIEENVEINKLYAYTIKEDHSADGYINILGDNIIHVGVVLNNNLDLELSTKITTGQEYVQRYGYYITDKDGAIIEDTETDLYNKITIQPDNDAEIPKVNVTIPNPIEANGSFDLDLIKYVKGTTIPLSGAGFTISIKDEAGKELMNDTSKVYTTGDDGRLTEKIEDILIEAANKEYTVTVTETQVPTGYEGSEGPITFKATSTQSGNNYALIAKELTTIENSKKVTVSPGKIVIEAENKPEGPHKGIKEIDNQNSGYDANELHDWVIQSKIPKDISKYQKYIITDTIDEKLVFSGLDKVKVSLEGNVLTKDTDYKLSYDEKTRQLKVSFIEGEFKGGQSLTEGSIVEIRFNTTFAVDENGKIIALNELVPNFAELTYGNTSNEEVKLKTETPKVHTGGIKVLKYETVNGKKVPLKGATFKIAETEDDAKNGKFIKVKDKDGKETNQDIVGISDNTGIVEFVGLEFGGDAKESKANKEIDPETGAEVYRYDIKFDTLSKKYWIVETEAPTGYIKAENPMEVTITKDSYNQEVANMPSVENIPQGNFDLALRKFITGVTTGSGTTDENKQEVTSRIPVFKVDENGNYVYEHTKEPVLVGNQNVVEYTIRVYNEGSIAGYAKEIKDDIPQGLEFLPDNETNKEYRWIMLDEVGNETDDVTKAKYITSDYLSKEQEKTVGENLLKPFDIESYKSGSIKEPDYKDVKVAFKVVLPEESDEIVINRAQISDDSDEDGNEVTDKDSTPNEWIDGEDDQDIEKIKVQYFDLALRKWVTKAIVIEDGKETVTETGHKAEDDPEAVVKVDLKKSKLDKVVVKFEYQIRVTNEGQIAGSVEEISDYIPQGLKFVAVDNPEWEEVEGKVVTDQLAGQILQPGESKEVTILLTWINREDNMGLKVNVAEISKDYNEYGSPDIDSTPNNQVPGEDDIDDAPVMLTVKTGQIAMYLGLTIAVLAILAGGIIIIKKFAIK